MLRVITLANTLVWAAWATGVIYFAYKNHAVLTEDDINAVMFLGFMTVVNTGALIINKK